MSEYAGKHSRVETGRYQSVHDRAVPTPGKHTLTEMLPAATTSAPVQRKAKATPVMPTGPRSTIDDLFGGIQRIGIGEISRREHPPVQRSASGLPFLQLGSSMNAAPIQQRASGDNAEHDPVTVHDAALRGISTSATQLPYIEHIQRSFGKHDVSGVKAHVGGDAAASAREMGAQAYATGDHVVLGPRADLHTVAHEAAHIVQQRGGVQLNGGVDEIGDSYERHADAVADRVMRGECAETLLGDSGTTRTATSVVQRSGNGRGQANMDKALQDEEEEGKEEEGKDEEEEGKDEEEEGKDEEEEGKDEAPKTTEADSSKGKEKDWEEEEKEEEESPCQLDGLARIDDEEPGLARIDNEVELAPFHTDEESEQLSSSAHDGPASAAAVAQGGPSTSSSQPGGGLASQEQTATENQTRIGFEIEPGVHYTLKTGDVRPYVNQTLLEYRHKSACLLELLLDDPKKADDVLILQAEFRTAPLPLTSVKSETRKIINDAISALVPSDVFGARPLANGWTRTEKCKQLILNLGTPKTQNRGFNVRGLAQHVTSSINLDAYAALGCDHQKALYPAGMGAKNRAALYARMVTALASQNPQSIDASTSGRNTKEVMVKVPVESMLAAESVLRLSGAAAAFDEANKATRPSKVKVDGTHSYAVQNLSNSVDAIVKRGCYPTVQGDEGVGYLAVAEKLRPPMRDTRNGSLRVLVEHRAADLVKAVNAMLNGTSTSQWRAFNVAVAAMEEKANGGSTARIETPNHVGDISKQRRIAAASSSQPGGAPSTRSDATSSRGRAMASTRRAVVRAPVVAGTPVPAGTSRYQAATRSSVARRDRGSDASSDVVSAVPSLRPRVIGSAGRAPSTSTSRGPVTAGASASGTGLATVATSSARSGAVRSSAVPVMAPTRPATGGTAATGVPSGARGRANAASTSSPGRSCAGGAGATDTHCASLH